MTFDLEFGLDYVLQSGYFRHSTKPTGKSLKGYCSKTWPSLMLKVEKSQDNAVVFWCQLLRLPLLIA